MLKDDGLNELIPISKLYRRIDMNSALKEIVS